jgi:hypothetical protein
MKAISKKTKKFWIGNPWVPEESSQSGMRIR